MNFKLTILSLFFSLLGFSQNHYFPGTIYFHNGDSLQTSIFYGGDNEMLTTCRYKIQGTSNEYTAKQIKAFRFTNGRYFVSLEYNHQPVFFEYVVNGKLNIYQRVESNSPIYYVQNRNGKIERLDYSERYIKTNDKHGKYVHFKSKKHIGTLKYVMRDEPSMVEQLTDIDKPNRKNLIDIAKTYHDKICEGEKCIIYYKEKESFYVNPFISFGSMKYKVHKEWINELSLGGLFWLPTINENLYLKVGFTKLLLINYDYQGEMIVYRPNVAEPKYDLHDLEHGIFLNLMYSKDLGFFNLIASPGVNMHVGNYYFNFDIGISKEFNNRFGLSLYYERKMGSSSYTNFVDDGLVASGFKLELNYSFGR